MAERWLFLGHRFGVPESHQIAALQVGTASLALHENTLVIGLLVLPTAIENAHPLEGQGTNGQMVTGLVAFQMELIEELGPLRMRYGLAGEFVKSLAEELGASPPE